MKSLTISLKATRMAAPTAVSEVRELWWIVGKVSSSISTCSRESLRFTSSSSGIGMNSSSKSATTIICGALSVDYNTRMTQERERFDKQARELDGSLTLRL